MVLHKLTVDQQSNSFPIAVGTKVVGVEDNTYSLTGEAFSSVALPETSVTTSKTLQEDDVTLGAPPECRLPPLDVSAKLTNPVPARLRQPTNLRGSFPLVALPSNAGLANSPARR